ncbi:MAG: hypothetical protein II278_04555, partial [Bacteroidaceae bacterium]|nr:hypothetical protein [Bacteroidaceae bacterium]
MSILIQGMEMPKNCRTCPMLFDGHSYRWCNITGESLGIEEADNGRNEYCPLIELPPHGRLIAEKTITEIRYHDADGYHIVNGEQLC